MSYYLNRSTGLGFDQAVAAITESLAAQGFGILSDIDVAATLKKKIDVDVPAYRILGACNPKLAHQALSAENKVGTMLPCNVIVRADAGGEVEVAAIDPVSAMAVVDNPQLAAIAAQVREKLQTALDQLPA
ncbi:MAG: DUF302 domain-containing protein [Wenzhouxiangellaceae bacterium]